MTLNELKQNVDAYVASGHGDNTVVFTLSERSAGGRAACGINGIYPGIDWENGQMRIDTEFDVCRRGRAKDDIAEMLVYAYSSPRRFYNCPMCGAHVKKDDQYCCQCGQRITYNQNKEPTDSWRADK